MLAPARYIADFARLLANKGTQERDDTQALLELEAAAARLPAGLELAGAADATARAGRARGRGSAVRPVRARAIHRQLHAQHALEARAGTRRISIEVAGVSFYHQGSANLIDDAIRERGVDYSLAAVAGRGFTGLLARVLGRLQPHTIIPTHYDDFFRPLAQPMGFTTNVNLAHVPAEIAAVSADISVTALPLLRR